MFIFEFIVKEHHLDAYKHMNHAVYFQLFEEARWETMAVQDCNIHKIEEMGQGPIVLGIQAKFKKEAKLREKLTIISECIGVRSNLVTKIKQRMINAKEQTVCEAIVDIGIFDTKKRKLVRMSEFWLNAFKAPV